MAEETFEKLKKLAEPIRRLVRAARGQSIDEDIFSGLINVKDARERTRLSEHDVYGHSAMQLIADWYRVEMGFWKDIAEMEDSYMISLDGEQRKEAILMARARTQVSLAPTPLAVQVPEVKTKPEEAKEEKKGFWRR